MKKKQEETKMSKIINIAWKVALVAAALCAAPAHAEEVDFAKIPDVRIFKGDETIGYRDPAAWYEDGVFHLFITVCDPSVPRMTIGHSTSRNLVDWSPVEYVLPRIGSAEGDRGRLLQELLHRHRVVRRPEGMDMARQGGDEVASIHRMKMRQFTERKYANSPNAIDLQGQYVL